MYEENEGEEQKHQPEIGALSQIEKAQVDVQISTAKRYPRTLSKVKQDMLSMATLDQETAMACFYTLRRKEKDGGTKLIQGPSIRLAEIAISCYGNIQAGARVISNDGKFIVAQGVCFDMEKNVRITMEVSRRITRSDGRTYSEDMQQTAGNAACSIALRNAALRVIPGALTKPVYEAAKKVATGDVKSLTAYRTKVLERLKAQGAEEANILAAVDARKVEDIDLIKLELLIGLGTSIKDGEMTLEEAFPKPVAEPAVAKGKESFLPVEGKAVDPSAAQGTDVPAEPAKEATVLEKDVPADLKPEPAKGPPVKETTKVPHDVLVSQLQGILDDNAITTAQFFEWLGSSGFMPDADAVSMLAEIPSPVLKRMVASKAGLIAQIKGGIK